MSSDWKKYAKGDTCPKCWITKLEFDAGDHPSPDVGDPGYGPAVFCRKCEDCFPFDAQRTANRLVAEQIAADLFENGAGQHAKRLVIELPDGRDGGGWCEGAVVDRVAKILDQWSATSE